MAKKKSIRRGEQATIQVAALPVAAGPDGELRVLLITSRETRRWVIPKGWPMKGRKDHEAAAQEAREEAGMVGEVRRTPLGHYAYSKRLPDGSQACLVTVYRLDVDHQLESWREKGQRELRWFPPDEAARLVDEPDLGRIILSVASSPDATLTVQAGETLPQPVA